MGKKQKQGTLPILDRWPSILAVLTGLVLMLYLGSILRSQYEAEIEFRSKITRHIADETRKLRTILEIYFDRCLKDVASMAMSRTVKKEPQKPAIGVSFQNGIQAVPSSLKAAADNLIKASQLNGNAIFQRIVIANPMGRTMYDTQNRSAPPNAHPAKGSVEPLDTTGATLYAQDNDLIIAAPVTWSGSIVSHVMAWLNKETLRKGFLVSFDQYCHTSSLLSDSGVIFFPDEFPKAFLSCGVDKIKKMPPETISTVSIGCNGMNRGAGDYIAIKLPIDRTPVSVFCILPTSKVTSLAEPWRHAIIMVALFTTLVYLFVMQLRISKKNSALKTRYTEANKQHADLIQSNEKLANEIILRKQAEAELKIVNEHLEEIVKHRTRKLEGAMSDLRNTQSQLIQTGKLASIGELAAGIAHELNQPLMVIRGNAQLMARTLEKSEGAPGDADDHLPSFFETVERNTKRMILIINHLRSFSRQSGTELEEVDINQVIRDAFLMIGEQLRLRNIETVFVLSDNLPRLQGAPYQLEQVILNLLANARDAIEAYQPAENEYRWKKEISITTRLVDDANDAVEILFSDTGCGINLKDEEKVFDPFFTTKAVGKGTGLGLSITYGILQEHNGSLEIVETKPGCTTFRIILPAQENG